MNKIFVSLNYGDKEIVKTITGMSSIYNGPVKREFVFVEGISTSWHEIEKKIKEALSQCSEVLFVVGDNNHNSPWIEREAQLALSQEKKIFLTRLPDTYGGIPKTLPKDKYEEIRWSGNHLANKLN
ncbi:hypothetical protein GV054_06920 [Marinomonas mediterranea]|uniref:TIR domain-containing protein n=1 Tax=Marinomonas mediterranea TaxID=119864 RepID=UPI00234A6B7C|nr:TIR domain-containing protein [Marinomonas mediterranea]WCN12767.1 hypothetical protein GV054_06920 [Marinomonas mediterranea]